MNDTIETFQVNDKTIEIYYDECGDLDPRQWDNYGVMVCFHRRYTLGEDHDYHTEDFSSWEELEEQIIKDHNPVVILPIYMYEHSCISLSTRSFYGRAHHAEWDSGRIGFIYATRSQVQLMQGWRRITASRRARIEKYLTSEVEEYGQWLNGEVYGYQIKDKEGNELDSCWGIIGFDACKEEAELMAAH